jgi:hypothetical protein
MSPALSDLCLQELYDVLERVEESGLFYSVDEEDEEDFDDFDEDEPEDVRERAGKRNASSGKTDIKANVQQIHIQVAQTACSLFGVLMRLQPPTKDERLAEIQKLFSDQSSMERMGDIMGNTFSILEYDATGRLVLSPGVYLLLFFWLMFA